MRIVSINKQEWEVYLRMSVVLGEHGEVLCPCGAMMKKLYWRQTRIFVDTAEVFIFTQWYGCTDCGKYIYDKHSDEYLQTLATTANFDDLLEAWFKESGVDFWDFDKPSFRLIDSGWFTPKQSFDEFVKARLHPNSECGERQ